MPAPDSIKKLVDQFEAHKDELMAQGYNENQLCRQYLDKFFRALGWDVDNDQGNALAYVEVVHQDALKTGGGTKVPDYAFRIGGTRKFFVEAKKPSVNVKDDTRPALQLRRYAWTAKLPLGIVTDFEELAIYDTRFSPSKNDKPDFARREYFTYKDYITRWDEIEAILSKKSVLNGNFDRYAGAAPKKGSIQVDEAFLKDIEAWRDALAHNIANRNKGQLSQPELNFAVQRTIDRIVFLRICEDRGIEKAERLKTATEGDGVYGRLLKLFQEADEKYDSGLFHFRKEKEETEQPDTITPRIVIDDKTLRDIIGKLYYPESPYEFSVLSADILGYVYEQFLSKVIRFTPTGQVKIEDKPEFKKAHGVYYTRTYIVDFIVRQTIGRLCDGKTPKQVSKLKVLDPACGSGAFLIGAYQYLLDWHREWYVKNEPLKWANAKVATLYKDAAGEWKLTTAERKRILLDNIYGVDLDLQAVEVTKLSLLLKVLEGENHETLKQLKLFHERALPYLGKNIKCGNSLVGPDFYEDEEAAALPMEEKVKLNAFDWNVEFASIVEDGGFDAVIGNPPYVRMEGFKALKKYLKSNYETHEERADLYSYFIEKGHCLLKKGGRFGIIVSNKFLRAKYGQPLRHFVANNATVTGIVDLAGLPVFKHTTVRTILLNTTKGVAKTYTFPYAPPMSIATFDDVSNGLVSMEAAIEKSIIEMDDASLAKGIWSFAAKETEGILEKLAQDSSSLQKYCKGKICRGVVSGLTEAFVIDAQTRKNLVSETPEAKEAIKPFLNGRDIRRYHIDSKNQYLIYAYHGFDIRKYPAIERHLRPYKERLLQRSTKQEWYELQQPQRNFAEYLGGTKIVFPDIATMPRFAMDTEGFFGSNTMYFIPKEDYFLLALLNSKVGFFYFKQVCAGLEGKNETYLRFFGQYLEGFPVRDAADPVKSKLSELAKKAATSRAEAVDLKTEHEKTTLQRQIDATDLQIDQLVYKLYGLTDEEIRLVEEGTK